MGSDDQGLEWSSREDFKYRSLLVKKLLTNKVEI